MKPETQPKKRPVANPPPHRTSTIVRSETTPAAGPSLATQAYAEIRRRILKGELPAGMVLSRRQLAEQLRISVPPVTEAFQHLEKEGLLESRPRSGTRVRIPTREDIEGHAVVREALEVQSARLFAERAAAAERRDLRQRGRQLDRLYTCCETGEVDRELLFSANTFHLGFHLRIAECGRVPALRAAIEKAQVLEFNSFYDTAVGRRSLGGNYHAILADALASGDVEKAQEAMREHIRGGLTEVLERLEKMPRETPGWRRRREEGSRESTRCHTTTPTAPPSGGGA